MFSICERHLLTLAGGGGGLPPISTMSHQASSKEGRRLDKHHNPLTEPAFWAESAWILVDQAAVQKRGPSTDFRYQIAGTRLSVAQLHACWPEVVRWAKAPRALRSRACKSLQPVEGLPRVPRGATPPLVPLPRSPPHALQALEVVRQARHICNAPGDVCVCMHVCIYVCV